MLTGPGLKAWLDKRSVSPAVFASDLDVDRSTVYRWVKSRGRLPRLIEYVIAAYNPTPEAALKGSQTSRVWTNLELPKPLRKKTCPQCGGGLWWAHSRGTRRRGIRGRIYVAICKAHAQDKNSCPVTVVYFDRKGNHLADLPKFAPRQQKRLRYERPRCPECELEMIIGRKALRRTTNLQGEVKDEEAQGFRCSGGRWGKPEHRLNTAYRNSKGGEVQVLLGKHKRLSELPRALRRSYPRCSRCGKEMRRQTTYHSKVGPIWHFRCTSCKVNRSFDDLGREHLPFDFGRQNPPCPECHRPLVKCRPPQSPGFGFLRSYHCTKHTVRHKRSRKHHYHRKTGREYIIRGQGLHCQAVPVEDAGG